MRYPGWRRFARRRAVAATLIAALIFVPGYLLVTRQDDGEAEGGGQPTLELAPLNQSLEDPKSGISVSWPEEWKHRKQRGAFAFQSPDRKLLISISAPGPAQDADEVRRGAIISTREEYKRPKVRHGKGRTISGREAKGAVIAGSRSGVRVRILVAVAKGRKRAYLLQVLSMPDVSSRTLVEAQRIMNSIELRR